MDATACSPGAASWFRCLAIGTVRAGSRHDNCGCCRRPLGATHGHEAPGPPGSAACHPAGEQNLAPRSGPISRVGLQLPARTPEQEEPAYELPLEQAGEQEQTRWCALDQDGVDGPVPDGDSTPIG